MPLPWKKPKVNRFSRLVADLHQSPKRGGSLVVETGFPTSLIDLFVKNRDRLRKPSKRKSSPQIQTPSAPPPSPPPQSSPSPSSSGAEELQSAEIDVAKLVLVKRECDERVSFHAAVKIFLVVALAVSTRNLALWIMMAAFLLVLMEFVGTRFFGFLIPESTPVFWDSLIRKCLLVLKRWDSKQGSSIVEEQGTIFPQSCELIDLENNCAEEIEIEESKFDCVAVGNGCESLETEVEVEEMKKISEILICKTERSRSSRIKRIFAKKLVPKKLRHGKKQGKINIKEEPWRADTHNKLEEIEEEKQEPNDDREDESQTEEEQSCKGVEEIGDTISTSVQLLWVESEIEIDKEKVGINVRKGKSGYVILFVIVLGGLVGGRGVALLLTLAWCLMLRNIGRIKRC